MKKADKKTMAKNLMSDINLQIQETQWTPNRINSNTTIKLLKPMTGRKYKSTQKKTMHYLRGEQ